MGSAYGISGCVGWWTPNVGVFSDAGTTPCKDGDLVYQFTDQSGAGNHLVQATAGSRVTFKKRGANVGYSTVVAAGSASYSFPSGMVLNGSAGYTILYFWRARPGWNQQGILNFSLGDGVQFYFNNGNGLQAQYVASATVGALLDTEKLALYGLRVNSPAYAVTFYQAGLSATVGGLDGNGNFTGGEIFSSTNFNSSGEAGEILVFNRALTDAEMLTIKTSIFPLLDTPLNYGSVQCLAFGDSIVNGYGNGQPSATYDQTGVHKMSIARPDIQFQNIGFVGETAGNAPNDFPYFDWFLTPVTGVKKFVFHDFGTNDINAGSNASTTIAAISHLNSVIHGYGAQVIEATIIDRGYSATPATQATMIGYAQSVNSAILAGTTGADFTVNSAADVRFATGTGAYNNGTYYQSDGTHPSIPLGQETLGQLWVPGIQTAVPINVATSYVVTGPTTLHQGETVTFTVSVVGGPPPGGADSFVLATIPGVVYLNAGVPITSVTFGNSTSPIVIQAQVAQTAPLINVATPAYVGAASTHVSGKNVGVTGQSVSITYPTSGGGGGAGPATSLYAAWQLAQVMGPELKDLFGDDE